MGCCKDNWLHYLRLTLLCSQNRERRQTSKRTQVIQIANYFKIDEKELLILWVADKVLDAIKGEDEFKQEAIKVAHAKIQSGTDSI